MICPNCNTREGTLKWAGESGAFYAARFLNTLPLWCELCTKRAQLAHAEKQAALVHLSRAEDAKMPRDQCYCDYESEEFE